MTKIDLKTMLKKIAIAFAVLPAICILAPNADAKPAKCVVRKGGDQVLNSQCNFQFTGNNGSFSLTRINGGEIMPSITDISVYIVSDGLAEVRGLTINGNNSRWGQARRNTSDPACWTGSDFEICAY